MAAPATDPVPDTAAAGWPLDLQELVGCPPVARYLAELGVRSLAEFGEVIDAAECHDVQLRAAVEMLPGQPKRSRVQKARARRVLQDLLARLWLFEEMDADEDGCLSRAEVHGPAAAKVMAK
eukprot:COSAG01_NODE_43808_length_426_cov_0.556575_2_plen_121_part_01